MRIDFLEFQRSDQHHLYALSELCFSFLHGGTSAFIAAIGSGLFKKNRKIDHLKSYGPNGPHRKKMGSNY